MQVKLSLFTFQSNSAIQSFAKPHSEMTSKHFLRAVVAIAVILVAIAGPQVVQGLKCNVCVITKKIHPSGCEVLPCNSLADVKHAMKSQYKQSISHRKNPPKSQPNFDIDPNDARAHATEFVCVRTVGGGRHSPSITSGCAARMPDFPPAVKAYKAKAYALAEVDAANLEEDDAKMLKAAFNRLEADVYICDEKVGNGVNCGEKSGTDIKKVGGGSGGDKTRSAAAAPAAEGAEDAAEAPDEGIKRMG